MASIDRVLVTWTGANALPGVSVFYGTPGAPALANDLYAFFDAIKALIPSVVTLTIPAAGDMVDDVTGALSGTWSASGVGTIGGIGPGAYAAGVGARVVWRTNGVRNGRRVRGSTFVCPLITNCYENDGSLSSSTIGTLTTAAGAVVTAGRLLVWSRPTNSTSGDGESNVVNAAQVPDRVTALRSRRY